VKRGAPSSHRTSLPRDEQIRDDSKRLWSVSCGDVGEDCGCLSGRATGYGQATGAGCPRGRRDDIGPVRRFDTESKDW